MRWYFKEQGNAVSRDSSSGLLVRNGETNVVPLVRESIQNSLDAQVDKNQPVRMSFKWVTVEGFNKSWTNGLEEHVTADKVGLDNNLVPQLLRENKVKCLVVEDFNTTGLTGPTTTRRPRGDASEHSFYYFIYNEGGSGKSGDKRGSWGHGKSVFQQASHLNLFYVWTIPENEIEVGRGKILGRCVLRNHFVGDRDYTPDGCFGGKPTDNTYAEVITDEGIINDFAVDVEANREDESGLTIVIPYLREEEYNFDDLVKEVIKNYYFAIQNDQLVVDVEDGARLIEIDAATIDRHADEYLEGTSDFNAVQRLAKIRQGAEPAFAFKPIEFGLRDYGKSLRNFLVEKELEKALEALDRGEAASVRINFRIQPKQDGISSKGYVDLYIFRHDKLSRKHPFFLRDDLFLTDIRTRNAPRNIFMALVASSTDGNGIGELLRAAENPAHTKWDDKNEDVRNNFENGPSWVRRMRRLPIELVRAINSVRDAEDVWTLAEIIPMPKSSKHGRLTTQLDFQNNVALEGNEEERTEHGIPSLRPSRDRYTATSLKDGFRIRGQGAIDDDNPLEIVMKVAYEIRRGNPFTQYSEYDFNFHKDSDLMIEGRGMVAYEVRGPNELFIMGTRDDFSLTIRGFDPYRDVIVDIVESGAKTTETAQ